LRWLSLCGIVAPVLDAVVVGIISAGQPSYDPVRDYLSVLTAPGHPLASSSRRLPLPSMLGSEATARPGSFLLCC
jgi:hypothetical protein